MRWLRDALCEPERAEAAAPRAWTPTRSWRRSPPTVPPGANGLLALFSNVMDVKRWVQAPPSFVGFDVADPDSHRPACLHPRGPGAGGLRDAGPPGHPRGAERARPFTEIGFTGGARQGPALAAHRGGRAGRHGAGARGQGVHGARRRAVRGPGRRPATATCASVAREVTRFERTIEPDPAAAAAYDEAFGRWSADLSPHPRARRGPPGGAHVVAGRRRCHAPPAVLIVRTQTEHAKEHPEMPEADSSERKQFHTDVPAANRAFYLKGSGAYDWGMQSRLARVFSPRSGRTVMLAIDHGYFQGPTTGLERVDVDIVPLLPKVDALFCTRGILRSSRARGRGHAGLPARQRRALDPQGALRRGDRPRHRGRPPAQRLRRRRAGLHRRAHRDEDGPQHDPPHRRGLPLRRAGPGRHRGRAAS